MAAITVKRKPKIGFREEAPVAAAEMAAAPEVVDVPVLTRYDSVSDGSSYVFAGICGLVAMFIFLGILFIQYTEYTYFQDSFILKGAYASAPSMTPSAPAVRSTPASEPAAAAPAAAPSASASATPAPAKAGDGGGNTKSKVDGRNAEVDAAVESK